MSKKVVIFGISILSEMIFYDASSSEDLNIAAFTVDYEYISGDDFLGLPLIDFKNVENIYPPEEYDMLMAFSGQFDMRLRKVMYERIKKKGYLLRNYISPKADFSDGIEMGENNIVMAFAHVGLNGFMGNNNLIRQHVYLGHDFNFRDHVFIAPGCRIGGKCTIGELSYIGLGAIINSNIAIGDESLVGTGAVVIRDTEPYSVNVGNPSRVISYHREKGIKVGV